MNEIDKAARLKMFSVASSFMFLMTLSYLRCCLMDVMITTTGKCGANLCNHGITQATFMSTRPVFKLKKIGKQDRISKFVNEVDQGLLSVFEVKVTDPLNIEVTVLRTGYVFNTAICDVANRHIRKIRMSKLRTIFVVAVILLALTICNQMMLSRKQRLVDYNLSKCNFTPSQAMQEERTNPPRIHVPADFYEIGFSDPSDEHFVEHVRLNWIHPPSANIPKMKEPIDHHFSQVGQSKYIDNLLKGKTNGFFIECGAHNGKSLSNSLYFERYRNWTGLLVEPNKKAFQELLNLKRKAHAANVLLCPDNTTRKINFVDSNFLSGMKEHVHLRSDSIAKSKKYPVQCFTLYTLLLAVGVTRVDYFSLDVEGAEISILKTIPFDKIYIKSLTVEYKFNDGHAIDKEKSHKNLKVIRDFFEKLGFYREVKLNGLDVIFERID
ncbi:unnamed protein product [Owenia fusiformis]|uniref:Methyltransferase FkbM domain-containing protein n=1 Tax=Owenia fusiformis TaxID=6347 RepID=A0A8S4NL19_OWEFU|nr:unnamed protein product [Owenia fusiformis]